MLSADEFSFFLDIDPQPSPTKNTHPPFFLEIENDVVTGSSQLDPSTAGQVFAGLALTPLPPSPNTNCLH